MPLHDWTRVRHGMFHHFHNAWIYGLAGILNGGLLPQGFYAAGEQIAGGIEPDVVALEHADSGSSWDHSGALAVVEHPLQATVQQAAETNAWIRKQDQLAVRRIGDDRLVSVIEIVSPANKSSRSRLASFIEKVAGLIGDGVHAVVIDVFPPGTFDRQGIHAAVWDELTAEPAPEGSAAAGQIASYGAGSTVRAYIEPLHLGATIPVTPLFLDEGWYVPLPLEETYQAVWEHYPSPWKTIVDPPRAS
ncbi:MAG TPA: DUF4058 family protein [Planctomycetaceae bacterium]|nr:DUF4058 family protein [Planctomycetaceae bacterium]